VLTGKDGVSGPTSFCKIAKEGQNKGKLVVTVKNIGSSEAPPTTTSILFIPGGQFQFPTPSIPTKRSIDLISDVPEACRRGDCDFIIIVDSDAQLDEDDEGNNTANGHCPG
jgi:subtilase family serine protease